MAFIKMVRFRLVFALFSIFIVCQEANAFELFINGNSTYTNDIIVRLTTAPPVCNSGDSQIGSLNVCNSGGGCQSYAAAYLDSVPWALTAGDGDKRVDITASCQHYVPQTCYRQYACGSYCCSYGRWGCNSYCTSYCTEPYDCSYYTSYTSSAFDTITFDTIPPIEPQVNGPSATYELRGQWTWTQGGGDGIHVFRIKLNDLDMSSGTIETNSTAYSTSLPPGTHTLYVSERDAAGNWSAASSHAILVDPLLDSDADGLIDSAEVALGSYRFNPDSDGDTVIDGTDNCVLTQNALQENFDLDSEGDVCDADDDSDGYIDIADAFPYDSSEWLDTDQDGIGNNADTDDDNDGVADISDAFPLDASAALDIDGDGFPELWNPGKTEADSTTALLLASADTDGDGLSNAAEGRTGLDPRVNNDGLPDGDADGLPDVYEVAVGLDPAVANGPAADADGDGYSDCHEYLLGLDPLVANDSDVDTDGDGLSDKLESALGTDSSVEDFGIDSDADGWTNAEEIRLGTLPAVPNDVMADSDMDGIPDTTERLAGLAPASDNRFSDLDSDGLSDIVEYLNGTLASSNSALVDSDDDGLPDLYEDANGLDSTVPNGADSDADGDGYGDYREYLLGLDPSVGNSGDADTDGDLISDLVEITLGMNPNDPADAGADADGDGLPNIVEAYNGTNPQLSNSGLADADADGIPDLIEIMSGSDPQSSNASMDSDDDGIFDPLEYRYGSFGIPNAQVRDTDADTLPDVYEHAYGLDALLDNSASDSDGDGSGDIQEYLLGTLPMNGDTDGDGTGDASDAFPLLVSESVDTDNDGIGNNADPDDDNDGLSDAQEVTLGTTPTNPDTDGDNVSDLIDVFPLLATEWIDTDLDGVGNNSDIDDDNDGLNDVDELALGTSPLNSDTDGDSVIDPADVFPLLASEWVDADHDGTGDNADPDDDNDGILDVADAEPFVPESVKPVLTVSTLPNGALTNIPSLNVSGSATDNAVLALLTINLVSIPVDNGNFSYLFDLEEGSNIITVVATDMAGNTTTDVRTVDLDTTAPALTIETPADNSASKDPAFDISGACGDAATVGIRVNNGAAQQATITGGTYTLQVSTLQGANSIDVTAYDAAGNASVTQHRTVTSDTSAPSVSVTAPNADKTTYVRIQSNNLILQGTYADNLSPVTLSVTVNGQSVPATDNGDGSFFLPVEFSAVGSYQVAVTATDGVGNAATAIRNLNFVMVGDVDGDGDVDSADALIALKMATGNMAADLKADVAPLTNGMTPNPDAQVTVGDAIVILRKAVDLW